MSRGGVLGVSGGVREQGPERPDVQPGTEPERKAAALALHASRDPAAAALLRHSPDLARAAAAGELNWQNLAITA